MNDNRTVELLDCGDFSGIDVLGTRTHSESVDSNARARTSWRVPTAVAVLAFGGGSTVIGGDLTEDRVSPSATTVSYQIDNVATVGTAVSRTQAMEIARNVLSRAEEERAILAENESLRGIQWDGE